MNINNLIIRPDNIFTLLLHQIQLKQTKIRQESQEKLTNYTLQINLQGIPSYVCPLKAKLEIGGKVERGR